MTLVWLHCYAIRSDCFGLVTSFQVGCPTYNKDLAELTRLLLEKGCSGIYHCSGPEAMGKAEWGHTVVSIAKKLGTSSLVETRFNIIIRQCVWLSQNIDQILNWGVLARSRYQGQAQVITSHSIWDVITCPCPWYLLQTQPAVECNYFSLPLIPASGTTLLWLRKAFDITPSRASLGVSTRVWFDILGRATTRQKWYPPLHYTNVIMGAMAS